MFLTNTLTAEQLFWGHSGLEYRFLSGADSPYASEVERLCASVGTPDGADPEPFLLSTPYKDKLIWARCCKGEPDKSSRPTLFFHILVVNREDVQRLSINAFDAMESNCFSRSVDSNPSVEIHVDSRYTPKNNGSNHRVIDNRVIISNCPESDAVFQLVQSRINEIPWATYSYHFMNQMELSVLSDKAPVPDFTSQKFPVYSVNAQKDNNKSALSPIMKKLFIGSLILNVVLFLGYFVLPSARPTNSDVAVQKPENISANSDGTIQRADDILEELKMELSKGRFTNVQWNTEKTSNWYLNLSDRESPNYTTSQIIDRYITLCNKYIFQEEENK